MFVNFTPITATSGRSPLVSLMFPTLKDKITDVNRFCEDTPPQTLAKGMAGSSVPRFLPSIELEKIVRLETVNRNSKYSALHTEQHSYHTN